MKKPASDIIILDKNENPQKFNFDRFLLNKKDFIIIKENSYEKIRKEINENKNKIRIFQASADEKLNRGVLEKLEINIYLSPELTEKKDKLKQRNSGLNQILAKIASEKKIKIGVNLSEIIKYRDKAKLLARIKQNIKLCRKSKTQIVVGTFAESKNQLRDAKDIKSLFVSLGMSTHQIKELFL